MDVSAIYQKVSNFISKLSGYLFAAALGGYIAFNVFQTSQENALEVLVLSSYQDRLQDNLKVLEFSDKEMECKLFEQATKSYKYLTTHIIEGQFILGAPNLAQDTEECIRDLISDFEHIKQQGKFKHCS